MPHVAAVPKFTEPTSSILLELGKDPATTGTIPDQVRARIDAEYQPILSLGKRVIADQINGGNLSFELGTAPVSFALGAPDFNDLSKVGWAIVFAKDTPQTVKDGARPAHHAPKATGRDSL